MDGNRFCGNLKTLRKSDPEPPPDLLRIQIRMGYPEEEISVSLWQAADPVKKILPTFH